jgi:hypothetical protein
MAIEFPPFPPLPEGWEPTRATLHAYSLGLDAIARAHGIADPRWWHVSLTVRPDGLATDPIPLPSGGAFTLRLDLRTHLAVLETSDGDTTQVGLGDGLTATDFTRRFTDHLATLGLDGPYDARFENDEPRPYVPDHARAFFDVLVEMAAVLETHRASLPGEVGPVQLWPHNFDLAFEWFAPGGGGRTGPQPQINLGFYPAAPAYVYSTPSPFATAQLDPVTLPGGAVWHHEGWDGAVLPYDRIQGKSDGAATLLAFAKAVFEAGAATLQS